MVEFLQKNSSIPKTVDPVPIMHKKNLKVVWKHNIKAIPK
ncbi:hypothetical protein CRYPA_231 [uncultured Candidatus Thioglobus sp.]|nr:hypothetical protein CRYPA_231 [uncultured Candidatus Thioglobus sp.]